MGFEATLFLDIEHLKFQFCKFELKNYDTQISWTFQSPEYGRENIQYIQYMFVTALQKITGTVTYYCISTFHIQVTKMFSWFEFQNFSAQLYKIGTLVNLWINQFYQKWFACNTFSNVYVHKHSWFETSCISLIAPSLFQSTLPFRIYTFQTKQDKKCPLRNYCCNLDNFESNLKLRDAEHVITKFTEDY